MLQITEESECKIENKVLEKIKNFWSEGTETMMSQKTAAVSTETGISVKNKRDSRRGFESFGKN